MGKGMTVFLASLVKSLNKSLSYKRSGVDIQLQPLPAPRNRRLSQGLGVLRQPE
jgi:hypothetical protein